VQVDDVSDFAGDESKEDGISEDVDDEGYKEIWRING
jgi:hypothetical protein